MLHSSFLLLLAVPGALGAFKFINPPPFEKTHDFSLNPIYPEGSILNIKWSDQTEENTSLTLWQLNGTQFMEPFEYLTQDVSGSVTSLNWKVQTTKDLSFSSMFYLSIFPEGTTSPLANSHYFNITSTKKDDEPKDKSSSTNSQSATTTATTTTASAPFITAAPTRAPSGSAPTPEVNNKDEHDEPPPPDPPKEPKEMSVGTKAAIGVGASVGALILICVAWFILRRRRRASASAATCNHYYEGEKYAQNLTPDHRRLSHPVELSGRPRVAPPTVFELPANSSL